MPFEVLVLTHSAVRLGRLREAARHEVPEHRRSWYSFATFDVLHPEQFGGPAWLTLEGEHVGLLYDQTFGGAASTDDTGASDAGAA